MSREQKAPWRSSLGAITILANRRPIIDVTFHGPVPTPQEYEDAFQEYARLAEAGEAILWLIDMRRFDPLKVDAATRRMAAGVFHRHHARLRPVSVAEARVTEDRMTRFILTAFDWLTIADKWPCQQFASLPEAERWLLQRHEQRRR